MKKQFKFTIPKPCHENWNEMTLNEKGRFCSSCAKTVVDFTQFSEAQVKEYLTEKSTQKVCGHFYKKQLHSVVIQIPESSLSHKHSFRNLFVLAMVLSMGTILFSCKTEGGKVQKIENVQIIDSIVEKQNPLIETNCNKKTLNKQELPTIGFPILQEETSTDSVHNEIKGDLAIEGEIEFKENERYPIHLVNKTPRFKEDKRLSEEKAKTNFQKRMTDFIEVNFDNKLSQSLGLRKGKFRIYARFIINDLGKVSDIQVRAPHEVLKKHTKEIIEKLPQFLPAKREGKIVNVSYVLPITFVVDE